MRPQPSRVSAIICNPSYKNAYVVNQIHDQNGLKKEETTPKGLNVQIHYIKGYQPERHIRLACCLQMGPDIILQDTGHMCFFVTKGVSPEGTDANVGGA